MKYFFFIFCFIFHNFVTAQEESAKGIDTTITWTQSKKLAWSDFQSEIDSDIFGKALTSYKIDFLPEDVLVDEQDKIQGYENITVVARFYKKQSWTTVAASDTVVLKHEQLHFDIAELFARKIRKKFKELQENGEARFSVYSEVYNQLWMESRKYQKQFDFETDHGRELDLNKIWFEKVKEELTLLAEYR